MDDSRAKSITDFRNIEISAIRIAKRMGKISHWVGDQDWGAGGQGQGTTVFFFLLVLSLLTLQTLNSGQE